MKKILNQRVLILCCTVFHLLPQFVFADEEEWVLPPIVTQISPADAMQNDPVLPVFEGRGTFGREKAFSVLERGGPGTQTTFLGVGASSEDTNIQAFGVSLSPPQGGGYDLSTFPQYLFSGYRFQAGASHSAFEPRAISGSLTLLPWTEEALSTPESHFRISQLYSSARLSQIAFGWDQGERAAFQLGLSDGDSKGPSGSFSARLGGGKAIQGKVHLLASSLDSRSPGSNLFSTPNAHQVTTRLVPVIQTDWLISSQALLKSSFHYDFLALKYEDPDSRFTTQDYTRQLGANSALLWKDWKFGLGFRDIDFQRTGFKAPSETQGFLQAARSFELGNTLIDPTFQMIGVSRSGILPEGSIGIRHEWSSPSERFAGRSHTYFGRLSLSRRFASLVDRYYEIPGFQGNPGLQPEKAWSTLIGWEIKDPRYEILFQEYGQYRQDAQVRLGVPSPFNAGHATFFALMNTIKYKAISWIVISNDFTFTKSRLSLSGESFPYQPRAFDILNFKLNPGYSPSLPLEADVTFRFSSGAVTGAQLAGGGAERVPGYGLLDLGLKSRIFGASPAPASQTLDAVFKIENAFDRVFELVKNYPALGRVISVALVGEF